MLCVFFWTFVAQTIFHICWKEHGKWQTMEHTRQHYNPIILTEWIALDWEWLNELIEKEMIHCERKKEMIDWEWMKDMVDCEWKKEMIDCEWRMDLIDCGWNAHISICLISSFSNPQTYTRPLSLLSLSLGLSLSLDVVLFLFLFGCGAFFFFGPLFKPVFFPMPSVAVWEQCGSNFL